MSSSQSTDVQVQVRLFTKQEQYAIPDSPCWIPVSSTIETLNNLVNAIILESQSDRQHVDFDFLINNEFLRLPLGEHLQGKEISTEDVIDVEYVERHPSPEPQDCLMHDDWVSSAQTFGKWILTGCYDGTVHIWTTKGTEVLTIPAHADPVKAVAWISVNDKTSTFVSVSHDQSAHIWQWNISDNAVECVVVCKGHERGLECVSVNKDGSLMATGSWDTFLKIWGASLEDTDAGESSSKRLKGDNGKVRTPQMTLQGHKEAILSAQWIDTNTIATASWDHTIKLWDAELGGIKSEIVGNKAFFDLDHSTVNNMIITCSADRHVRLYDPRSNEGSLVKQTYTSHTQWVQSVCWSKNEEHLFLSGGYDNQVKLWDCRSSKAPLFELSGHEDNVLTCDWSNPKYMVSGGKDNTVRIFKSKNANKKELES
ncbi:ribosome biogenesis protein WDR12 homolog [Ctenocephalides felis]|uniref:ribosome biogenesis protein WDR12 homolog n=1 Tax=Ctenocephalides felis TaxID=7515 RepID=UPI000E6E4B3C|nr:ribosome biogenesis protein WDR12 homolog [Ctenocephalides felis]